MNTLNLLKSVLLTSLLIIPLFSSADSKSDTLNTAAISQLTVRNLANPQASVFTGGQPSQDALATLAASGVKHVINLRPVPEQQQALQWSEEQLVKSLDMQYHSIPVAGAAGINIENATKVAELLETLQGQPTFLHCASSNRVGALTALYEGAVNGLSTDDAIAIGKRWGLNSLEPIVRAQLNK